MKRLETNKKSFKLPEKYFNQLEENILIELKKFTEEDGFSVSENYFSDLENQIVSKTVNASKRGKARKFRIMVSSAAACIIFLTLVLLPLFNKKEEVNFVKTSVDQKTEDAVYESLYDSYFENEEQKKSSNEITLDDLDEFYSSQQLSSNN